MFDDIDISHTFDPRKKVVLYPGDCLEFLRAIPDERFQLIVTSPPYNLGKEYEKRIHLDDYLEQQARIIAECTRALRRSGSICWEVGNYVDKGEIVPLDAVLYPIFKSLGLQLRNRVVWRFDHGLHCTKRFSGRYETILWFTKSNDYLFNLDPIRVPQKYPGKKHYKGPKAGQYSSNPLGKNPSDIWDIPNVKSNHVEKTGHPCQFPVELVERLVLSMTNKGDWVFDPFVGTGTSIIAAIKHGRRGAGAELAPTYVKLSEERIKKAAAGTLKTRPMSRPVFDPKDAGRYLTETPWQKDPNQLKLLQDTKGYKP